MVIKDNVVTYGVGRNDTVISENVETDGAPLEISYKEECEKSLQSGLHNKVSLQRRGTALRTSHNKTFSKIQKPNVVLKSTQGYLRVQTRNTYLAQRESGEEGISLPELLAQSPERVFCDQDRDGDNELMIAIIKRLEQYATLIVEILVKRNSKTLLDLENANGQTALHLAVKTDMTEVTAALVKAGVDLEIRDNDGNTPLHCASSMGLLTHVKILTDITKTTSTGSLVMPKTAELANYQGWNCVHLAVKNGHTDITEYLVKNVGVDINKRGGSRGMTGLHIAVQACDVTMVIFLVQVVKADVNLPTYDDWSPIEMAAGYKHDIFITLLLKSGAYHGDLIRFQHYMIAEHSDDYDSD